MTLALPDLRRAASAGFSSGPVWRGFLCGARVVVVPVPLEVPLVEEPLPPQPAIAMLHRHDGYQR